MNYVNFPFIVNSDRRDGSFNIFDNAFWMLVDISDKLWVSNKTEDVNVKIVNNLNIDLTVKCNLNWKWKKKIKSCCECKTLSRRYVYNRNYIWKPTTCACGCDTK